MKKNIKFITCLILLITALFALNTNSFAEDASVDSSVGGIINAGQSFIDAGVNTNAVIPTDERIRDTSNLIYNVVFILGLIVMVIWGMVLGIKFITGSVEEQAEVKKGLFPYGVGCIIIIGGYTIWRVVVIIVQQFA